MGPLRRGLILSLLPGPALAAVCDDARPNWDGVPVTAFAEAVSLLSTPPALILLVATALVVRFKNQWGGLVVVVLWTLFASLLTMFDPTGVREIATQEGCFGSPALFIAAVAAICVAMILYTAPRTPAGKTDGD